MHHRRHDCGMDSPLGPQVQDSHRGFLHNRGICLVHHALCIQLHAVEEHGGRWRVFWNSWTKLQLQAAKSRHEPGTARSRFFSHVGFSMENINSIMDGWGILINTFYKFDSWGINHIKILTRKPVWSIGPILAPVVFDDKVIDLRIINNWGKATDINEEECLQWLRSWGCEIPSCPQRAIR